MKYFIFTVAMTAMMSAGCCTGRSQNCCDDNREREVGLFASREAPRGEVAVSLPGVMRPNPGLRSRDESFSSRLRSGAAPIGPDADSEKDSAKDRDYVNDRDSQSTRSVPVEERVSRLQRLIEAMDQKIDSMDKKIDDKCKS